MSEEARGHIAVNDALQRYLKARQSVPPEHSGEKGRVARDESEIEQLSKMGPCRCGNPDCCSMARSAPAPSHPEDDLAARLEAAAAMLDSLAMTGAIARDLRKAASRLRANPNPESLGSTGTGDLGSSVEGARVWVPEEAIREAIAECDGMDDPHRFHALCAKLMSRVSAYGPCHDHGVSDPCTPACPVYDAVLDPASDSSTEGER